MLREALAQVDVNLGVPADSGFENLTNVSVGALISSAIQAILVIAAIVFFFILVIGGVKWITSGGDKGQTEAARKQITAALVGLVIVFAAWAIVRLVGGFFGVDLLGNLSIIPPNGAYEEEE